MVLVDTSVWIRFLANRMPYAAELDRLLERDEVAGHDLVYGELLIGDSGGRTQLLNSYDPIYPLPPVGHSDVPTFLRSHKFHGRGSGWVDSHLLPSALVSHPSPCTAHPPLPTL